VTSSEITIVLEEIQASVQEDTGIARIVEYLNNAILQAEMTEPLQAQLEERTVTFNLALFTRHQQSKKAVVTSLMEMLRGCLPER